VGCLANVIILTDLLASLMQTVGLPAALYGSRAAVTSLLCVGVIYPLCSLTDLKALQGTSLLGLVGQIIAMAVVGVRVADKAYLPGGRFATTAAVVKDVAREGPVVLRWAVFASLLSYCFVTHYNAPKYRAELENNTPARIGQLVGLSYLGAALFYSASLYLGIAAFGPACKPYLISNLSPADPLASIARVAIASSILASTPLMFMNVRNWLVGIAKKRLPAVGGVKRMAALLVLTMGALATRLTDIGKIGSVAGAIFGTNMMFTFPPIMYARALQQDATRTGKPLRRWVVGVHGLLALCGAALSAVAAYHSILQCFR
jgi:sodium-coupled neutral amino acid transporter 11